MLAKKRVLVFPCGSEIGLELHRALAWSTHIDLIGGSSVSSNHGKYVYRGYTEGIPYVEDPSFIEKMNEVVERHKIDYIFPAHDSVVLKLSENAERISCEVIGSPLETCRICRSKKLTYETLSKVLRVPMMYRDDDKRLVYPVFLKPDVGQGSRGTHIAGSVEELSFFLRKRPDLLLLEYLPGREFTVECFTDRHRSLLFIGARERIRITNGIVMDTRAASDSRFDKMADSINKRFEFRGAWFFQVKMDAKGEPALLEVAPRTAGGMGLFRNLGVNLALLSVFDRMNLDVSVLLNTYGLEMDRALVNRFASDISYDHVYLDLDDTLLFKGKVNPWLVAFLYQCFNTGKKAHLLTSHVGDPAPLLKKHRLGSLFDSVVHVEKDEEKADYIKEPLSIFIDDSFSERVRVKRRLGIPVFSADAIESLIDWRM